MHPKTRVYISSRLTCNPVTQHGHPTWPPCLFTLYIHLFLYSFLFVYFIIYYLYIICAVFPMSMTWTKRVPLLLWLAQGCCNVKMSRISRNPSLRFFQDFDVGILLDGGTRHRPPLHKNHVICFTRYLQRFPQALFSRFLSCQQVISSGLISGFSKIQPKKIISNGTCRFGSWQIAFRPSPELWGESGRKHEGWIGMVWRFPQRFLHLSSVGKSLSMSICGINSSLLYFEVQFQPRDVWDPRVRDVTFTSWAALAEESAHGHLTMFCQSLAPFILSSTRLNCRGKLSPKRFLSLLHFLFSVFAHFSQHVSHLQDQLIQSFLRCHRLKNSSTPWREIRA